MGCGGRSKCQDLSWWGKPIIRASRPDNKGLVSDSIARPLALGETVVTLF